jgi:hypothetical protein
MRNIAVDGKGAGRCHAANGRGFRGTDVECVLFYWVLTVVYLRVCTCTTTWIQVFSIVDSLAQTVTQPSSNGTGSLARPGRKQATATKLWLLQPTQTKFRRLCFQPDLRGSNDLCVGRKMATFQLFFQSGRAKDLLAPLYVSNLTNLRNHHQRPDRLWGTPRRRRVKLTAISILWWRPIKPKNKFLLHTLGVKYTPLG